MRTNHFKELWSYHMTTFLTYDICQKVLTRAQAGVESGGRGGGGGGGGGAGSAGGAHYW